MSAHSVFTEGRSPLNPDPPPIEAPSPRFWHLLLLGTLGMTLSEGFIWNARPVQRALVNGPVAVIAGILVVLAVYTLMMAWIADLAHRYRVRDTLGLLLLGCLYGLVNEGFFAPHLLSGPPVPGVSLIFLLFPTLSWHPAVVALPAIHLYHRFAGGGINLSNPLLSAVEVRNLLLVCAFWFPWQYSRWQQQWHPQGFSLALQAIFVAVPLLLLAVILPRVVRQDNPFADGVLSPTQRQTVQLLLGLVATLQLLRVPNKLGFILVLFLMQVYWTLFLRTRPHPVGDSPGVSMLLPAPPVDRTFSWLRYLSGVLVVVVAYLLFQGATHLWHLHRIWAGVAHAGVLAALVVALGIHVWAVTASLRSPSRRIPKGDGL